MVRMTENLKAANDPANDRRERQRFKITAPVTLFIGDREIPAYTRDLSNRGVYFYLAPADSPQIDLEFEFTVELPPEITLSSFCQIRCKGRTVRAEEALDMSGVAAEILEYSISRDPMTTT
jgi:PilZ domain